MSKKRKIGIFGGTFNPVHNGHIRLAEMFYNELKLDMVLVIPTCIPPHKDVNFTVSSQDRWSMLKLAFENCSWAVLSDIELKSNQKNYTIDTLNKLFEIYPDDEFYLIVGGDMFLSFETWKEYKKVLSVCKVCTAPREKEELDKLYNYQNVIDPEHKNTIILSATVLEISSTDIRENISSFENLIPISVYDYIIKNGLYNND